MWQIPEGGLCENLVEPVADLVAHQRRVGVIQWHPTAQNILLSGGRCISHICVGCHIPVANLLVPCMGGPTSFNLFRPLDELSPSIAIFCHSFPLSVIRLCPFMIFLNTVPLSWFWSPSSPATTLSCFP